MSHEYYTLPQNLETRYKISTAYPTLFNIYYLYIGIYALWTELYMSILYILQLCISACWSVAYLPWVEIEVTGAIYSYITHQQAFYILFFKNDYNIQ